MSDATADPRNRVELDELLARIERQQAETRKFAEEAMKLQAENRKLFAEELKLHAENRKLEAEAGKLRRDTLVAPWIAGAAAGAGILAVLQLLFKAAGWLP